MIIDSINKLVKYFKTNNIAKGSVKLENKNSLIVSRKILNDIEFRNLSLGGTYQNCKFTNCSFKNIFGFFLKLKDCKFINCKFENSRFSHFEDIVIGSWDGIQFDKCYFTNVQFDEGEMYNIFFNECNFTHFKIDCIQPTINVNFYKCNINESFFNGTKHYEESEIYKDEILDLFFNECRIDDSVFNGADLRNSVFMNARIYKSVFLDCKLSRYTLVESKENKYPDYVSLDFQTILKSDTLDFNILKKYFNIHTPDIKKIALGITSEINFKTVFISYSFKDKILANYINDELFKNGVKTFLWEKDAPGGQLLEDIMENNIKKHDKILFIASQNSIKSKACQFELSKARKKQEDTWSSDLFFVIHLDSFLFEVEKNKIRPISKADEYWENISELRRVNSQDFSMFNTDNMEYEKLEIAIRNIISELKI
jgi:uncharacterized protein YjbI with pentapeptide repeats